MTLKLLIGFILATLALVLLSVLHGRRIERGKAEKASLEAVTNILKNTQDTDEAVKDMTDEELDKNF